MELNIQSPEVERMAADIAALTGASKTEAIRKSRLSLGVAESKREHPWRFLGEEIWPTIPKEQLGRTLSREEEDDILGYGPDGV